MLMKTKKKRGFDSNLFSDFFLRWWPIFFFQKEVDKHGYYIVTMMEGRKSNKLHTETKTILLMERSRGLCVINDPIRRPFFTWRVGFCFTLAKINKSNQKSLSKKNHFTTDVESSRICFDRAHIITREMMVVMKLSPDYLIAHKKTRFSAFDP